MTSQKTKNPAKAGFLQVRKFLKSNQKVTEIFRDYLFSAISFLTITAAATMKVMISASSIGVP